MTDQQMVEAALYRTRVLVVATDYKYEGKVMTAFMKNSEVWRCVVEDDCGRLFIHNARQLMPL